MKQTNLLFLGFVLLFAGIVALLTRPYNIFKSDLLAFLLIVLGTFLIIAEIITYHWFQYR